jgi:hypothetical protein
MDSISAAFDRDPQHDQYDERERRKSIYAAKEIFLDCLWASDRVSATAAKIMRVIVHHYNEAEGFAWPSYNRIMRRAACSKSSVQRALSSLQAQGWLEVEERFRPEYGLRCNHYIPIWAKADEFLATQEGQERLR